VPLTPSTTSSSFSKMSAASLNIVTPTTTKRIVNMAYVSVPPSPWLTPSSSRKGSAHMYSTNGKIKLNDTPDDLGGYGSEEDGPSSPTKRRGIMDSVKSSARRTGDRDERGQKHSDM
jgi:cohesin loading factor subunit SCC2